MTAISTGRIHVDTQGVAWIEDTNVKVTEVVLDHLAHGWSPEEIHFQHRHLSLAQIHTALAYYYDHQSEIDQEIERQGQATDALAAAASDSPFRRRLSTLDRLS